METIQGFCDFNIPFAMSTSNMLKEIVMEAVRLGYHVIAINTTIEEDEFVSLKKAKGKDKFEQVAPKKDVPVPPNLGFLENDLSLMAHGKCVKILHRLTVKLSNPANFQRMVQSPITKMYDLISVCPMTMLAFQHLLTNPDIDIISFHPNQDEFRFNRRHYSQAVDKGIFFEIPYSSLLRDSSLRKKIFQMAHMFHSLGKSQNILLSSGALSPLELRSPYDVASLGSLLGMTEAQARSALALASREVALHAGARKTGKCVNNIENCVDVAGKEKPSVEENGVTGNKVFDEPLIKKSKLT